MLTCAARALPAALPRADLVIVATRDPDIPRVATALRTALGQPSRIVHCSGALSADALADLRAEGHAVGTMHPLASFASARHTPDLRGVALVITGDAGARRAARKLGRKLEMVCLEPGSLDAASYHAAAALVANGAAAIAAAAAALLTQAGLDPEKHGMLLGPLLRTVAENVRRLGPEAALTGPIRRGDVATVERHLEVASRANLLSLYRALGLAQVPLAERLRDAPAGTLDRVRLLLSNEGEIP